MALNAYPPFFHTRILCSCQPFPGACIVGGGRLRRSLVDGHRIVCGGGDPTRRLRPRYRRGRSQPTAGDDGRQGPSDQSVSTVKVAAQRAPAPPFLSAARAAAVIRDGARLWRVPPFRFRLILAARGRAGLARAGQGALWRHRPLLLVVVRRIESTKCKVLSAGQCQATR